MILKNSETNSKSLTQKNDENVTAKLWFLISKLAINIEKSRLFYFSY